MALDGRCEAAISMEEASAVMKGRRAYLEPVDSFFYDFMQISKRLAFTFDL
jgi:hypothetical protein